MTWIRWECASPSHEIVGALAEALSIDPMQALGHYTAACCGFGEYRRDGDSLAVTDTTLETWAHWTGKRGRFAALFRTRCVETRPLQRDPVGTVKGWWRQVAWLTKQATDAGKPSWKDRQSLKEMEEIPQESPKIPPEIPPEYLKVFLGDIDNNSYKQRTTASHPPRVNSAWLTTLTPESMELVELTLRSATQVKQVGLLAGLGSLFADQDPGNRHFTPAEISEAIVACAGLGNPLTPRTLASLMLRAREVATRPPMSDGEEFATLARKLRAEEAATTEAPSP